MKAAPDATRLSLGDFFLSDSEDPLRPSDDWTRWRTQTRWATSLYEQRLLDGPRPTTRLHTSEDQLVVNMASYNYLGMGQDPRVIAAAKRALDRYGTGACGSPLLSGMTDLHRELELRLARFLRREDCLLFNSGFGGALGMMSGLLRREDVALLDEKCHISLVDGVKLSGARLVSFRHNDVDQLDELLGTHRGSRRMVVLEGIYSMDGNLGNLRAICEVARFHGVGVVVDEAHSILTLGAGGRGAVEYLGCERDVVLQYGTFSKAFAGVGGFVAGPRELIDYLRCFATSYAFSCALPPSVVAGILAVLDIVDADRSAISRLASNSEYFRAGLHRIGIDTGQSCTQVVPLIMGADRKRLYEQGLALRAQGLFLAVIDFPSVPEDSLRFRASVTAAHTRSELDQALRIIQEVLAPEIERTADSPSRWV